jgi:hypothetical protein
MRDYVFRGKPLCVAMPLRVSAHVAVPTSHACEAEEELTVLYLSQTYPEDDNVRLCRNVGTVQRFTTDFSNKNTIIVIFLYV